MGETKGNLPLKRGARGEDQQPEEEDKILSLFWTGETKGKKTGGPKVAAGQKPDEESIKGSQRRFLLEGEKRLELMRRTTVAASASG